MNGESTVNGSEVSVALGTTVMARPGFFDPLADEMGASECPSAESSRGERTDGRTERPGIRSEPRTMVEFLTPTQLRETVVPEGSKMVGDYHIEKGSPFVLGGAPGVGKSRAAVALAVAGATGQDWFGLKVHRRFRTMILQAENGRVRLKNEFSDLDCPGLDGWVCVSPQPPYGFAFMDRAFLALLRAAVDAFKPEVFVIDPWNQCVRDSTEKDYMEGFERIRGALPVGEDCPALGIVAHTRKPRMGEKASGRSLLNLLSGSYVLTSVPRSVFVIQPGSDATEDKRIVFTCCKNNNGELGPRSVWERRNGLFAPVQSFDWEAFDGGGKQTKKGVTEEHIRKVFQNGDARMLLKAAAEKLQEVAGVGRTVAYEALKLDGEFSGLLDRRSDHTIGLTEGGVVIVECS